MKFETLKGSFSRRHTFHIIMLDAQKFTEDVRVGVKQKQNQLKRTHAKTKTKKKNKAPTVMTLWSRYR